MRLQITGLLLVFVAIVAALGAIAATRPDRAAAIQALDALGLVNVRVLSVIVPCRYDGGFTLYGVYFDAAIGVSRGVNSACLRMRDRTWTLSRPFNEG